MNNGICIFTPFYKPEVGAAPTRWWQWSTYFYAKGIPCKVVTNYPVYPNRTYNPRLLSSAFRFVPYSAEAPLLIMRLPTLPYKESKLLRGVSLVIYCFLSFFTAIFNRNRIWLINGIPILLPLLLALIRGKQRKFVPVVSDIWSDTLTKRFGANSLIIKSIVAIESWVFKRADLLILLTDGLQQRVIEKYGLNPNKLMIIPNGRLQSELPEVHYDESKDTILYFGNLGGVYDFDTLFAAFDRVCEHDPKMKLRIIGDGKELNRIKELRSCSPNKERISLLGAIDVEEIAHYLGDVLCSVIPLKEIEDLASVRPARIPVLASYGISQIVVGDCEGGRMIVNQQAGAMLPSGDIEGLVDAISLRISDPSLNRKESENARKWARESLLLDGHLDKLIDVINP